MPLTRGTARRGVAVAALLGASVLAFAGAPAVAAGPLPYTDQAYDSTVSPTSTGSKVMLPGDEIVEPFVAQAGGTLSDVHLRLNSFDAGTDFRVRVTSNSNWPRPGVVLASKRFIVSSATMTVDLSSADVTLVEGTQYVLALDSFVGEVSVRTATPDGAGGSTMRFYDAVWDGWFTISGKGVYGSVDVTGTDGDLPTVVADVAPGAANGDAGWYVTRPTVSYECDDATTRVVDCPSSTQVADGVTHFAPSVTDLAGNVGTASAFTLKVDTVEPNVSIELAREPNAHGWYRSAVAYTVDCSDATSGVGACPGGGTAGSYGEVVVQAYDVAGNSRERSVLVKIDKRDPRVRIPGLSEGERFTSKPTLGCRARDGKGDAASGVRTCRTTTERLTTHKHRATAKAADHAGNRGIERVVFYVR